MTRGGRFGWRAAFTAVGIAWTAVSMAGANALANEACVYDIRIMDAGAERLEITAACAAPDGSPYEFRPGTAALGAFVERIDGGEGWLALHRDGLATLRYRLRLGAFADAADSIERVKRYGRSILALPQAFLVRPAEPDRAILFEVTTEPDVPARFATALQRWRGRYLLEGRDLFFAGYTAFGQFDRVEIDLPRPPFARADDPRERASLSLVTLDGKLDSRGDVLRDWVEMSARMVAAEFGGASDWQSLLIVAPTAGRSDVPFGRVIGTGGLSAIVLVGEHATMDQLYGDWVLVHELLHTASPFVFDNGAWFMEGMATYAEPILRARAGWLSAEDVWAEFARGMPRGLAPMGDAGLGQSGSRGAYWGGALFMLKADIEIRQATGGGKTLADCLRRLLRDGGNATQRWNQAKVLRTCDEETGTSVLSHLAALHVARGTPVDLPELWRLLGIESDGRGARFRDNAPLAWVRRSIIPEQPGRQ